MASMQCLHLLWVLFIIVLYCTVLYFTVLYSVLCCIVLYCTVLYFTVLYSVLCCIVLYCIVLYCIAAITPLVSVYQLIFTLKSLNVRPVPGSPKKNLAGVIAMTFLSPVKALMTTTVSTAALEWNVLTTLRNWHKFVRWIQAAEHTDVCEDWYWAIRATTGQYETELMRRPAHGVHCTSTQSII